MENTVTIRRAEAQDIPRMLELLTQVNLIHHIGRPDLFKVATKYTNEQLKALLPDDERPIFVALNADGVVMGYAFCVFKQELHDNILTDVKSLYIDDLCVDENARGLHIGKRLYDRVCAFAKEQNCYNVTLNVWSFNEPAIKFYEAQGFKPQKTIMEVIL